MIQKYIKKWNIVIIMLTSLCMGKSLAQAPPVSVKMGTSATDTVLYQHGYNKSGNSAVSPREDRDSVMAGSAMPYFVMPDPTYNSAYNASTSGGDYSQTNLTTSKFAWTLPANGSLVKYVNPNSKDGQTSPRVMIRWNTASAKPSTDTIRIVETPTEYNGQALSNVCPGAESKIPVTVINKSTVQFGLHNGAREVSNCYTFNSSLPNSSSNVYPSFSFPLTLTTEVAGNKGIKVKYTIKKDAGAESSPTEVTVADITQLPITFDDYGVYIIKITAITDPISRKCGIEGDVLAAAGVNEFKYVVLPQPKPGPTYHIPNNF